MLGEVERGTWPASSMWHAAPSVTRRHQWFGAVCNAICLWWYQKQEFGKTRGLQNGELRRRKSQSDLCLIWTVSISTLPAQTILHICWSITSYKITLLISHGWHLVNGLCLLSVQHSLCFPNPCRYLRQTRTVLVKAVKVRTLILIDVVYTVDHVVIVNRVTRVNNRRIRIIKWQLVM